MLVHDSTISFEVPDKPRKELVLLSHHDGDEGHPARDASEGLVHAEVEVKKAAWKERLFQGSAGARMVREGSVSFDASASEETFGGDTKPEADSATSPLPRWKPRWTPSQLRAMEDAKAKFAADAKVSYDEPKVGAKSEAFAVEPTFFNILYTHPSFGSMPWGEVGTESDTMRLLPPINSRAGGLITPAQRRAARVNWGNGRFAFPANKLRDLPAAEVAVSPSKHCTASKPLPKAPKAPKVSDSTNPWLRQPPHTTRSKALYEAMYGLSPNDPRLQRKSQDQAAAKLQSMQRGRNVRKNASR